MAACPTDGPCFTASEEVAISAAINMQPIHAKLEKLPNNIKEDLGDTDAANQKKVLKTGY